ncbi:uncharacterized protein LOC141918953, partial [Strix aluco]|uniref:uncharacterized protein LOC141918953 n=1 Tax=Strix aluco TaxID=111821 RepID=UPI003DA2AF7E
MTPSPRPSAALPAGGRRLYSSRFRPRPRPLTSGGAPPPSLGHFRRRSSPVLQHPFLVLQHPLFREEEAGLPLPAAAAAVAAGRGGGGGSAAARCGAAEPWSFPVEATTTWPSRGRRTPSSPGPRRSTPPSLGDEEFEIPPIALDADPSLAVSDVVGHFEDLGEPGGGPPDPPFPPPPYGVQGLEMPVGIGHGLMEQGAGLLAGGLAM